MKMTMFQDNNKDIRYNRTCMKITMFQDINEDEMARWGWNREILGMRMPSHLHEDDVTGQKIKIK